MLRERGAEGALHSSISKGFFRFTMHYCNSIGAAGSGKVAFRFAGLFPCMNQNQVEIFGLLGAGKGAESALRNGHYRRDYSAWGIHQAAYLKGCGGAANAPMGEGALHPSCKAFPDRCTKQTRMAAGNGGGCLGAESMAP